MSKLHNHGIIVKDEKLTINQIKSFVILNDSLIKAFFAIFLILREIRANIIENMFKSSSS